MDSSGSHPPNLGARLLSLDGSRTGMTDLSELMLLRELMQRIEDLLNLDETPPPCLHFELIGGTGVGGIFAILFAAWRLTVDEAIDVYYALCENVFSSEAWSSHDMEATRSILEETVRDIAHTLDKDAEQMLGLKKVSGVNHKAFTCTLNPENMAGPRLLCTYRPRANRSPPCTVTQAIIASLAGQPHLEPLVLGRPAEKFVSGVQRVANPTSQLFNEAEAVFGADQPVACVVSIGAGQKGPIAFATDGTSDSVTLAKLVSDAEQSNQEIERRCGNVKDLYFRFNVIHGLEDELGSVEALSTVATHSSQYLGLTAIKARLDRLVKVLCERPTAVTAGRLNSVLGPDAQDRSLTRIEEGVKRSNTILQDDRYHDIVTWLTPNHSFFGTLRECRETREDGTGLWLLELSEFREWLRGDIRMLMLQGIPGGGKTILASIVYDHLSATNSNNCYTILGAFITYGITKSIDDILACLLIQVLYASDRRLAPEIEVLYEQRAFGQPSRQDLLNTLKARLSNATRVFIVLDALDEFPSDSRKELLLTLLGLSPAVSLFVTSRPLPEMQLERISASCYQMDESKQADILFYVLKRVQRDERLIRVLSGKNELTVKILESVVKRCNGMFLLARFHMDELCTYRTPVALEKALKSLPTTANEKYSIALDRMRQQRGKDSDYAYQTLAWMTLQKAWPILTIKDLILAVASSTNELGDSTDTVTLSEQDIIDVSAGLVIVKNGYPAFVHMTAQEFFRIHFTDSEANMRVLCDAQDKLARGCLRYMLLHHSDNEARFLNYCFLHFGDHVRQSKHCEEMTRTLFSNQALFTQCKHKLLRELSLFPLGSTNVDVDSFTALHWASCLGLLPTCSSLLQATNVNIRDFQGNSPLSYAARSGHHAVVKLLLNQAHIDVNTVAKNGQSPLSLAAEHGKLDVVQLLLSRPDVEADSRDNDGRTSFSHAAEGGRLDVVQLPLSRTVVEADSRGKNGRSPLSYAAEQGRLDIVQLLLSRTDVAVDSRDSKGRTPLSHAAERERLDVVQLLLNQTDVKANTRDNKGRTPLSHATGGYLGGLDVVQLLLNRTDAEVDSRDNDGQTPLSHAAKEGKLDVVQLLLSRTDVAVDSRDSNGRTPLSHAAERERLDIVQLLLSPADVTVDSRDISGQTPLSHAAGRYLGGIHVVQLLLSRTDVEVDSRDQSGRSPLSYAAEQGRLDVVQLLLSRTDVEADSRDNNGRSPVSHAAERGRLDVVRLLLSRPDVEADSRDTCGRSPLSRAAQWGSLDVNQLFLSRTDVEVDSRDNFGQTPLSCAARCGSLHVVQLLLSQTNIETDSKDNNGRTPLSHAAAWGRLDVVQVLLNRTDAEVDSRDNDGQTPLSHAVKGGKTDVVQLLLSQTDVKADTRDNKGRTPLSHATGGYLGGLDVVQLLLSRTHVKADSRDNNGRSPLSHAAERGCLRVVQLLLSQTNVQADSRDNLGITPLFYAANRGNLNVVQLLLSQTDVKADSRDNFGLTPLFYAANRGYLNVVYLLSQGDCAVDSESLIGRLIAYEAAKSGSRIFDERWGSYYSVEDSRGVLELLISYEKFEPDVKTVVEIARFYTKLWKWQRETAEDYDGSETEEETDTEENRKEEGGDSVEG